MATTAPTATIWFYIVERMPAGSHRFLGVLRRHARTPKSIHTRGYRLKVDWIDARAIPTKMIHF